MSKKNSRKEKDGFKEIDLSAMMKAYKSCGTKLSYEEWYAKNLLDYQRQDPEAIMIFKESTDEKPVSNISGASDGERNDIPKGRKRHDDNSHCDEPADGQAEKGNGDGVPVGGDGQPAGLVDVHPNVVMQDGQINALEEQKGQGPIYPPSKNKPVNKNNFGLNARQFQFCMEYIKDFNATRSYKAAGYVCKTESTATSSASKHLTKHLSLIHI